MQFRKIWFHGLAALVLSSGGLLCAQDEGGLANIHPADVRIERKADDSPARFKGFPDQPKFVPPANPQVAAQVHDDDQHGIFDNQLRGGELSDRQIGEPEGNDTPTFVQPQRMQADFDSQPQPPRPSRKNDSNMPQVHRAADPMQELNPNRLMPLFQPLAPDGGGQSKQASRAQQQSFDPPQSAGVIPRQPALASPTYRASEIPEAYPQGAPAVSTTGFQQTINSSQRNESGNPQNVKSLLAEYEVSNFSQLPGVPVSLEDLLRSTPVPSRMSMIQQYWETYFDWATHRNDIAFEAWLGQLPNPGTGPEAMLLETARSMAANDKLASRIQLSRSQSKLQQLSQWNGGDLLPLPLNQPLTSKYITHYEWYAQRQRLPSRLKGINEMLPQTYELLASRAATVGQALQTRDQMKQAFASRQLGMGDLLEAGRTWRLSMNSFVGTAVSYNQAISDYALTITPPQNPVDQIVSMLIAKPDSVAEVAQRNSILQRTTQTPQQAPAANRIDEFGTNQPANSMRQPVGQTNGQQQSDFQPDSSQANSGGNLQPGTNAFSPDRRPQSNDANSFDAGGGNTPASTRQFNNGGGAFGGR